MAKYALTTGINVYGGDSDLAGCVADANDWFTELTNRGFQCERLIDQEATKANILDALRKLIAAAKYGDVALFQFSGHGSFVPDQDGDEPDQRDEVLCPADTMAGQLITDDEIDQIFQERDRGVRLIFISDSCHSGTVSRFAALPVSTQPGPSPFRSRVRFLPPATFLVPRLLSRANAVLNTPVTRKIGSAALLISGCQDHEFSYDAEFNGKPNGAFTYAALEALREIPIGALYRDWYKRIRDKLPSSSYPQTPNLLAARYQRNWPALIEGR